MRKISLASLSMVCTLLVLLAGCAAEMAPGGGPPDKTPPELILQNIPNASVNISPTQTFLFTFSEKLNSDVIKKNITLFPLKENVIDISYRNKTIAISPLQTWEENTIYTLIFEKGISDLRSNSLKAPIQFTFSTGDHIPKNEIIGKILDIPSNKTAKIFLSRKTQDTQEIISKPEYFTQSSSEGIFTFSYMPADTFYIAAYIDEDNSNSYKATFDLPCVPQTKYMIPDTSRSSFLLQALPDNFSPAKLISAQSNSPWETQLSFSKILSNKTTIKNFTLNNTYPDTIIINNKNITLYHTEFKDSLSLSFTGLKDRLNVKLDDSTSTVSIKEWEDEYYHFEQINDLLRCYPHPELNKLSGVFQSQDTTDITLHKSLPGFYTLPKVKKEKNGLFLPELSIEMKKESSISDSVYTISLKLPAIKEYGQVLAYCQNTPDQDIRFVLSSKNNDYETLAQAKDITFKNILPGTYSLKYYHDKNQDKTRNLGTLSPFSSPEFMFLLEENIDVKARWDTELSDPFKIEIENK